MKSEEYIRNVKKGIEYFDPESFDWKNYSWLIITHYLELFNPDKYDWMGASLLVPELCPHYIDIYADKFNWYDCSWIAAVWCPDYCLKHFDKFNWESGSDFLPEEHYKKMKLKLNGKEDKLDG